MLARVGLEAGGSSGKRYKLLWSWMSSAVGHLPLDSSESNNGLLPQAALQAQQCSMCTGAGWFNLSLIVR